MHDLVIHGGQVYDGTGSPWTAADVVIDRGRVTAVGRGTPGAARRRIDATGLVVAPGFIDIHTHADLALMQDPRLEPAVLQGVTTNVIGNCGLGFAPASDASLPLLREAYGAAFGPADRVDFGWRRVADLLARYDGRTSVNVACLVPHAALRVSVMGLARRAASPAERQQMASLLDQALTEGAFGLTTGLWYSPLDVADEEELLSLCAAAGRRGGFLAVHLRDYRQHVADAVREVLQVTRQAGLPLHISHFQFPDQAQGSSAALLALIDEARAGGQDVTVDSYPYCAGSTLLSAFLPQWTLEGGASQTLARLRDRTVRARIVAEMGQSGYRWDRAVVSSVATPANRPLEGRSLTDIARQRGLGPEETICDLLIEEQLAVVVVYHGTIEEDVERVMRHPAHMAASDSLHMAGKPHPRLYGTFARYLGRYVREREVLRLEEAIRKMTSQPARRLGLADRGLLWPGLAADVVVFDAQTVRDEATFEDPCRAPKGIVYVIVNGEVTVEHGRHTGRLAGQALRPG